MKDKNKKEAPLMWPTPRLAMSDESYETWRERMASKTDPKSRTKTKPDSLAIAVRMYEEPTNNNDER
jgi:hypothetical protein